MEDKSHRAMPVLPGILPALVLDRGNPAWRHVMAPARRRGGA